MERNENVNYIVIEDKANEYGYKAKKIMIFELILASLGTVLLYMVIPSSYKFLYIIVLGSVVLLCHIISLRQTLRGYHLMQTKIIKQMVLYQVIVSVSAVVMLCGGMGIAYVFWRLFLGFAPEKITFFEFITGV